MDCQTDKEAMGKRRRKDGDIHTGTEGPRDETASRTHAAT